MLMVIFGAGASYDSDPNRPADALPGLTWRPPLANELFSPTKGNVTNILLRYRKCVPLINRLRQAIAHGASIETRLEEFAVEAGADAARQRQLAALRLAIRDIIRSATDTWERESAEVNNFEEALDIIRVWAGARRESVCFITFNYDTLLDVAFANVFGQPLANIEDYILGRPFYLFKPHGSVNWSRETMDPLTGQTLRSGNDGWSALIDARPSFALSDRYHVSGDLTAEGGATLFPAIAIPVAAKSEFECPPSHLHELRQCIPEVTRLIIVGWRATEAHFTSLWRGHINSQLYIHSVNRDSTENEAVRGRLAQAGVTGRFTASDGGFTKFLDEHELEVVLNA